jgi:undecaprenyl-diphosphatase
VIARVQLWWRQAGWDDFVRILGMVTFFSAVWLFVELAADAPDGDYLFIETPLMEALRRDGGPIGPWWFTEAMRDATALGGAAFIILMTLLVVGYLCLSRRFRVAALIAIATAGGAALNEGLKAAFGRERPDTALHLVEVRSMSFPSGHAMAGSIFYLTIGALLARTAHRRREKTYLVGCAVLLTVLVGFSRVYLGVHYPTDVLAGWSAGVAWALLCWFIADWLARRGALREEADADPPDDA